MCDNPSTLLENCLDSICNNISEIFPLHSNLREEESFKFQNKDNNFLCNELSEMLLQTLIEKDLIDDSTALIFSTSNTCLKRVKLKDANNITAKGLRVLLKHKIHELECTNVKNIRVNGIIDLLNDWSMKNLKSLHITKTRSLEFTSPGVMNRLTQIKSLKSLNVSYTELNQNCFQILCEKLPFLEKLNVSGTYVLDLEPLMGLSDKLLTLGISDLRLCPTNADHILRLNHLKHLDISVINEKPTPAEDNIVKRILTQTNSLSELYSLDISGWKNPCDKEIILKFIETHPKLECLGLVTNPIASDAIFSRNKRKFFVAGLTSDQQIIRTLNCYEDKAYFVQKALYHLFQLTSGFEGPRPDMINKVLTAMKTHSTKFGVQVAGTACLYNLTRAELSKQIHPGLLGKGVRLILDAMTRFHDEYQLQKNCLLNLCSDRILQEVDIDRFRCANLVLEALCGFDEADIKRMAVAICSILAAKISTEETSELGARPVYMHNLLEMVRSRVELKQSDITLKFTLSALWNLTDESAATCDVFLGHGGANLFLNVLQTFKGDNAIETKVLGLLNNIAEVEILRPNLFIEELITELYFLLKSEHIDVGYFAAGIIAHLASDGEENWTIKSYGRREMLGQLEEAVNEWKLPECEMVAYRRFKPFFPLLKDGMEYQVQLWAVWAIYHVCNKNPKRYCKMLSEENGILLLKHLAYSDGSHVTIKKMTQQILEIVEENTR